MRGFRYGLGVDESRVVLVVMVGSGWILVVLGGLRGFGVVKGRALVMVRGYGYSGKVGNVV